MTGGLSTLARTTSYDGRVQRLLVFVTVGAQRLGIWPQHKQTLPSARVGLTWLLVVPCGEGNAQVVHVLPNV
jgi:hypothetical protein